MEPGYHIHGINSPGQVAAEAKAGDPGDLLTVPPNAVHVLPGDDLTATIEGASAGDTIAVHPATYSTGGNITATDKTIIGFGGVPVIEAGFDTITGGEWRGVDFVDTVAATYASAMLDGCKVEATASDATAMLLSDDDTVLYDCTLISTGTGKSVASDSEGTGRNVVAAHCRMNAAPSADITNLVEDGYNALDSSF